MIVALWKTRRSLTGIWNPSCFSSANEGVQFSKARSALHGTFARHGNRATGAGVAQRVVDRFAFFAARRVREDKGGTDKGGTDKGGTDGTFTCLLRLLLQR
jgi:hypothetical protein